MKIQGWVLAGILVIGSSLGCGDISTDTSQDPQVPLPSDSEPQSLDVVGAARFGNQCPYGSYAPPFSVPITLYNCPLNLPKVELADALPSLILQADCKKKILDVRSEDRSVEPTTWEIMPDGNFYFSIFAGYARLKDDGSGHPLCYAPMSADIWGKVDCKDRDQATIDVETVWWLGRPMNTPSSRPSGVPAPVPAPEPAPTLRPVPVPSVSPMPMPSPAPTFTILPLPTPSPTLSPVPMPTVTVTPTPNPPRLGFPELFPPSPISLRMDVGQPRTPACQMPSGCYFHNITRIKQCY